MPTWHERMTQRPEPAPRLELLERLWQLRAPSGHLLECVLYRTDVGLELRAEAELVRSERVRTQAAGRDLGAIWKAAVLGKAGCTEA